MIVAYPPGGASDLTIRALAPGASGALGQPLVIENRSGANGGIAMTAVARGPTDGQTFVIAAESAVYRTLLRSDLGYDGLRDLDPTPPADAGLCRDPLTAAGHVPGQARVSGTAGCRGPRGCLRRGLRDRHRGFGARSRVGPRTTRRLRPPCRIVSAAGRGCRPRRSLDPSSGVHDAQGCSRDSSRRRSDHASAS